LKPFSNGLFECMTPVKMLLMLLFQLGFCFVEVNIEGGFILAHADTAPISEPPGPIDGL